MPENKVNEGYNYHQWEGFFLNSTLPLPLDALKWHTRENKQKWRMLSIHDMLKQLSFRYNYQWKCNENIAKAMKGEILQEEPPLRGDT